MSLNTAHADHGVLIHTGECIILFSDNVEVKFYGNDFPAFKGEKEGRMYLTTHRMIFNSKKNTDPMRSFSFPFIMLQDVTVEQPMFSANSIKGKVRAQPNGGFVGEVKFNLVFKKGGAIEFGQAMLKSAHRASQSMNGNAPPPPYMPPSGPWMPAAPPQYAANPTATYGWLPPFAAQAFPDQPPPNSVFVSDNPPPYPGVMGMTYPPGVGFSGMGAPNGGLYPDTSQVPQYPGAPSAPTGISSNDAKAAEAAQSAYFDPNKPQTAYVPPPNYDHLPTYQESTSKKDN